MHASCQAVSERFLAMPVFALSLKPPTKVVSRQHLSDGDCGGGGDGDGGDLAVGNDGVVMVY